MRTMRLLICTQAVDTENTVLGFFHRWIEVISRHYESVLVICLKEGKHSLPPHVRVVSLGKEKGFSRINYVATFLRTVVRERNSYDSVFVHMNQEYVLMGGLIWRFLGKKVGMWRNHNHGTVLTRAAVFLAHVVFCTSPHSFTARFKKTTLMPVGIDTTLFAPAPEKRKPNSILFLGRMDTIKKPDLLVAACALVKKEASYNVDMVGDPTYLPSSFYEEIKQKAKSQDVSHVTFHKGVTQNEAREWYQSHDIFVNLTPSGSLDKTIFEAMASGCRIAVCNQALTSVDQQHVLETCDPKSVADLIESMLEESEQETDALRKNLRTFVEEKHSLSALASLLHKELQPLNN